MLIQNAPNLKKISYNFVFSCPVICLGIAPLTTKIRPCRALQLLLFVVWRSVIKLSFESSSSFDSSFFLTTKVMQVFTQDQCFNYRLSGGSASLNAFASLYLFVVCMFVCLFFSFPILVDFKPERRLALSETTVRTNRQTQI